MVSQIRLQNAARHFMWDVSTSHLTKEDSERLQSASVSDLPRTVPHKYGAIVFIDSDDEAVKSAITALRERGMSETFIDLYVSACRDRKSMLLNFDSSAQVLPGVPTFNW